jgi:hypothetical protein
VVPPSSSLVQAAPTNASATNGTNARLIVIRMMSPLHGATMHRHFPTVG